MAQWVKSRLCKHATLSSDPRHAQKSQVSGPEPLRVYQPASLANQPAPSSAEIPLQKLRQRACAPIHKTPHKIKNKTK